MRSVGLDLSYSRTGFACLDRSIQDGSQTHALGRFSTEPGGNFVKRTVDIKNWIADRLNELEASQKVDVIVLEGATTDSNVSALLSGLNITIQTYLYEVRKWSRILVVPPSSLKRYHGAKGKGKTSVVECARDLFGPLKGVCHDEVDALFLASLGADYLTLSLTDMMEDCESDSYERMKRALHILYTKELNKKGQPKGLVLRPGEFYFDERS